MYCARLRVNALLPHNLGRAVGGNHLRTGEYFGLRAGVGDGDLLGVSRGADVLPEERA